MLLSLDKGGHLDLILSAGHVETGIHGDGMVGLYGLYPNSNLNCISRESYGCLAGGWIPYYHELAISGYPLYMTSLSAYITRLIYMY